MVKKVGPCYYSHISNVKELIQEIKDDILVRWIYFVLHRNSSRVLSALKGLKVQGLYTKMPVVVKCNIKEYSVSLIECAEWDTVEEPTVGDSYCFKYKDNCEKKIKGGTKVYHNKWQFVSNDYTGFDIEKSKKRTEEWNQIQGISEIKHKIGSKNFWYSFLKENNL